MKLVYVLALLGVIMMISTASAAPLAVCDYPYTPENDNGVVGVDTPGQNGCDVHSSACVFVGGWGHGIGAC